MNLMRIGERIVGGVKNLSGRAKNAVEEAPTKLKTEVKSGIRSATGADGKLTPKQEKQLVGRLDYLHLLHSKRVPRPAGSEVAHIKEPNLQEAVTIDVSPEKWKQREEFTKRLKDELHGKEASATVITDSEQKQIDKLIADIKHPTEVKEPSDAQTVKEASATTGGSDVRTRKVDITNAGKNGQLKNETGNNDQTTGTGTETPREGQPTDGTGDGTQTADAGTKTPDKKQAAQPDGRESSGTSTAPKSGDEYKPAEYAKKAAKDQNLDSSERQMYGRLGTMRANAQKVFNKGTDKQIKNELGRWGIEAKDGDKVADYMNKIDEMLKEKAESGPTIGDKFRAHHGVGLTGLGVVGVSTLDLANSRGQQSNAQLYSDPFA